MRISPPVSETPRSMKMSNPSFPALALLGILLLGCTAEQETPLAETARAEMIGMSRGEVITCLGPPGKASAAGSIDTWSYSYDSCAVALTITGGKVTAAAYIAPANEDKTTDEQCARIPEVVSCVRWLRN